MYDDYDDKGESFAETGETRGERMCKNAKLFSQELIFCSKWKAREAIGAYFWKKTDLCSNGAPVL